MWHYFIFYGTLYDTIWITQFPGEIEMICIIKWRWGLLCVLFFREENTININRVFYYYYIRKILYTRRIKISIFKYFFVCTSSIYTNDILYVYVKEKARWYCRGACIFSVWYEMYDMISYKSFYINTFVFLI